MPAASPFWAAIGMSKSTPPPCRQPQRNTEQGTVLYVTGEESASQLKLRAGRLGVGGDMLILAEKRPFRHRGEVDRIKPAYVMIDSIQTMYSADCSGSNGNTSQTRKPPPHNPHGKARRRGHIIVGHVTKTAP